MPTLFFLPWVTCNQPIRIGPVQLIPFERGKSPGTTSNITQPMFDGVLGNYANRSHGLSKAMALPVPKATILWWDGDDDSTVLADADIAERAQFGQFLTFSALAERRFGSYSGYCNSDELTMIAQRFDAANPTSVSITTRRRDGYGTNYMGGTNDSPLFLRPLHVADRQRVEVDIHLLTALLKVPDLDLKSRLMDSIVVFNRANTDASEVPATVEIVMLRVAFETLLEASHMAADLQRCFWVCLAGVLPAPKWHTGIYDESIWRSRWGHSVTRPFDAWVQDFCSVRNNSAHGTKMKSKHPPSVWSLHNHLLFASWLFPLMVKKILSNYDLLNLSPMDNDLLAGCERFLAEDVLSIESGVRLRWTRIDAKLREGELARALYDLPKN